MMLALSSHPHPSPWLEAEEGMPAQAGAGANDGANNPAICTRMVCDRSESDCNISARSSGLCELGAFSTAAVVRDFLEG